LNVVFRFFFQEKPYFCLNNLFNVVNGYTNRQSYQSTVSAVARRFYNAPLSCVASIGNSDGIICIKRKLTAVHAPFCIVDEILHKCSCIVSFAVLFFFVLLNANDCVVAELAYIAVNASSLNSFNVVSQC
jgi:hypothetical protein